jgi:multiple sugar transport system substrate-binding protein
MEEESETFLLRIQGQAMRFTATIRIGMIGIVSSLVFLTGCSPQSSPPPESPVRLVLKLGKIFGDPGPLRRLLDQFEKENPGIRVREEMLPSSSDEQHQFYATNLEAGSSDFDVFSLDVIWVPSFARAGWLREVGHLLPAAERDDFFPGPVEAVQYRDRWFALPWYIDAGLLYYRKGLLEKYGFRPPRTWPELVQAAQAVLGKEKGIYGFLWQGKQYEGLVCNVLEYMGSNGGRVFQKGRAVIDSPENQEALGFMRDLIVKYRVSPPLVTSAVEETTRNIFGNGGALFMRNWPYAWGLLQREGSPVRGKIGIAPLPFFPGGKSAPTLGGWQLGLNRHSRHPREAEKLLIFLASSSSQRFLALSVGYHPTRKSLYRDRDLADAQPLLPRLYGIFREAIPRPVTPYYLMITQVLQPEFSAALSGIKSPGQALRSARKQVEHIMGAE